MLGFTRSGARARKRPMGRSPPDFSAHLIVIAWQTHVSVFCQPPATPHQRPQGRLGILRQQRQERRARAANKKVGIASASGFPFSSFLLFLLISLLAFARNYIDVFPLQGSQRSEELAFDNPYPRGPGSPDPAPGCRYQPNPHMPIRRYPNHPPKRMPIRRRTLRLVQ